MKYQFNKYPVDIFLFLLLGVLLLLTVLLDLHEMVRILVGLPVIFFIPGYLLIFILYPLKTEENGLKIIERIGLSFGFSIALVSLLGLVLNFTPMGIQITSVLLSLFVVTECLGLIAFYQWKTTNPAKRFSIFNVEFQPIAQSRIEKILTILVIVSVFLALSSVTYIVTHPKDIDGFTHFYLLTPERTTTGYPQDIPAGQQTSLILGIINHEYSEMDYTVEIWLIDETTIFNKSTQKNETIYNHAWFLEKVVVTLNHTEITNIKNSTEKWEHHYNFTLTKIGLYKLAFLLYTTPSEIYDPKQDYKDSIHQKMRNAYRGLHLWVYVG